MTQTTSIKTTLHDPKLDELRLKDPLSTVTRTERRTLLGASAIGVVIVKSGLVPSRISALGIEFSQTDQRSLLRALAAIVAYFLVAFLLYAVTDLVAWRTALISAIDDLVSEQTSNRARAEEHAGTIREVSVILPIHRFNILWFKASKPTSVLRAVFEFALPVVIGIYAIVLLIRSSW